MFIFADHCVHGDVIETLRNSGFQVVRAFEKKLDRAADEEIFEYAQKHSSALLTMDQDFANTVRFDIVGSYGVVIVMMMGQIDRKQVIGNVVHFFQERRAKKLKGHLFLIDRDGTHMWPSKTWSR